MGVVNICKFNKVILEFLEEAYDRPKREFTWFTNNDPKSGLLGSIETIDSDEAS